jgi:hypothetical protein
MVSTRTLVRLGGLALLALGGVLAVGSGIVHLAWGLPLEELPLRPVVLEGVVVAALGGVLLVVAHRHPAGERVERTIPAPESPLRLAS